MLAFIKAYPEANDQPLRSTTRGERFSDLQISPAHFLLEVHAVRTGPRMIAVASDARSNTLAGLYRDSQFGLDRLSEHRQRNPNTGSPRDCRGLELRDQDHSIWVHSIAMVAPVRPPRSMLADFDCNFPVNDARTVDAQRAITIPWRTIDFLMADISDCNVQLIMVNLQSNFRTQY